MAISLDEHIVPVKQATFVRPDRPLNISTVYRWIRRGDLETIVIGGRRYTSIEAIRRFVERSTARADGERHHYCPSPHIDPNLERRLDEAGI